MFVLQLLIFLVFPLIVYRSAQKVKWVGFISPVVICYALGLVMANQGWLVLDTSLSKEVAEVAVPLSIPLLLFSLNFKIFGKHMKRGLLSYSLGVVAVVISSLMVSLWYREEFTDWWKMAGMMIGVYTGGTPNLSAIGLSLGVAEETFILLNTADTLVSGIYLLFLLSIAQRLLLLFLPSYESLKIDNENEEAGTFSHVMVWRDILMSFLLSTLLVGLSVGLSVLFFSEIVETVVLLLITTGGIVASFMPSVKKMRPSYTLGEYFLLVFCVAIGSLADFQQIATHGVNILLYTGSIVLMTVVLHYLLAFLFKIDADTVIMSSVAGVFGPAFIGPVGSALQNKAIVGVGLTLGLLGYAIANYLGIMMALILKP